MGRWALSRGPVPQSAGLTGGRCVCWRRPRRCRREAGCTGGASGAKAVLGAVSVWPAAGGAGVRVGGAAESRAHHYLAPPDSPPTPPGLWLLRAESGLSLWVLSWGPQRGGYLQAAPGPAGAPRGGAGPGRPGAKGRGSLFRTRTGSAGRWDGARRRREGRDCAGLGAWCR